MDDKYIYLTIPSKYKCIYIKLLVKLADLGIDILKDCSSTCKGERKVLINSWYMFQSACAAYNIGEEKKADFIIDYIVKQYNFKCDENTDAPIDPSQPIENVIMLGNYNGTPQVFKDASYNDIINNSIITEHKVIGNSLNTFTMTQNTNISFLIVPSEIELVKSFFGESIITYLWSGDKDSSAYRIKEVTNDDKVLTIYWFYSPSIFSDIITIQCTNKI